jgi:hypothetical protein
MNIYQRDKVIRKQMTIFFSHLFLYKSFRFWFVFVSRPTPSKSFGKFKCLGTKIINENYTEKLIRDEIRGMLTTIRS